MRPIDNRMPSSHSDEMITNVRIAVPFEGGGGEGEDDEEEERLAKITISVTKIMTYHGRRGISWRQALLVLEWPSRMATGKRKLWTARRMRHDIQSYEIPDNLNPLKHSGHTLNQFCSTFLPATTIKIQNMYAYQ